MLTEPIKAAVRDISATEQARPPTTAVQAEKSGSAPEKALELSSDALKEIAENLQGNLNMIHNVDLKFSIHESTGKIMVTVKDASTGKVIRELLPREILNLASKLDEMIGLILDERG
jgi:flagellar protein FlaG